MRAHTCAQASTHECAGAHTPTVWRVCTPAGTLVGVAAVDGSVVAIKMPTPPSAAVDQPYPVDQANAETNKPFLTAGQAQ